MSGYVLITAAHNEAAFIARTCESVLAQTRPPLRWIVVDDASSDETGAIVERYRAAHPGRIELVRVERAPGRDFRNKVRAFDHGLAHARQAIHLRRQPRRRHRAAARLLREDAGAVPQQSRAGHRRRHGPLAHRRRVRRQNVALDSVAGAVQLFRRECFERSAATCRCAGVASTPRPRSWPGRRAGGCGRSPTSRSSNIDAPARRRPTRSRRGVARARGSIRSAT